METVIDPIVEETRIDTRKSSKTGNDYNMLVVKLVGGSEIEVFLDKAYAELAKVLVNAK